MTTAAPPRELFAPGRKVGLALGSGAARGMCYIGILDAFEEQGIPIGCIAGTSIGALLGAMYASGVPVSRMEEVACSLNWRRLTRLLDPIIPTSGLLDGKKVANFIADLLPARSFEELTIPLAVTATDVETGELVVIRHGDLLDAIQAAIAFPGLFAPVRIGDRFLVDGGLCAPVPTDIVEKMGAETIIGVCAIPEVEKNYSETFAPANNRPSAIGRFLDNFNSEWIENRFREIWQGGGDRSEPATPPERKPPGIFRVFAQSIAIMENQINALRLQQNTVDLLIRPDLKDITLLEFHRAKEAISAGRHAAQTALKPLNEEL